MGNLFKSALTTYQKTLTANYFFEHAFWEYISLKKES